MEEEQRRLAAIVAADVVGYSRLMGQDESGTLATLKAVRRDVVDPGIARHNGRIVKTTGDGLLLEFASVVDAVRCVLSVQADMATRMAELPADKRIVFRVGVNVGDVIIDGDDIFGEGVNVAARLEGLAEPGGVCLSDDAWRQVRGKIDAPFVSMGPLALKNIAYPVEVWRSGSSASASGTPHVALALPDRPSIAVLPFQNMSGDPEREYFADGMTEDILTALSRFQNLFVIARNSSFGYKGKAVDIKQVGRELGVRYVLEGSVRAAADRVRITAQLIDAVSGHHVWADRYDRAVADIFAVQDEVTAQIVATIDLEVRAAEAQRPGGAPAAGLGAWAQYHKSFPLLFHLTAEDNRTAVEKFGELRDSCPDFASAHAGYGFARSSEAIYRWTEDRASSARAAVGPCRRAVELDDKDAFCHFALGRALLVTGERDSALVSIERAVARNPNSAAAHLFRGVALVGLERYAEALAAVDLAIRLSPRDPALWSFYLWQATCRCGLGDVEGGIEAARRAVHERPDMWISHIALALSFARANRLADGRTAIAKASELLPGLTLETVDELHGPFLSSRGVEEIHRVAAALGLKPRSADTTDKAVAVPDKPSIAVLPFQNMSGDPEQEYFADGVVDDIITGLSRNRQLFVIARNSSFVYKGRPVDVRQLGRDLGVRYVLEGSVRKAGGRIRIAGQLIDARSGNHLWADRVEGSLDDVFSLQDRVTASVLGAIGPAVERAEIERAQGKPTDSLQAYDFYLRGLAESYKWSRDANRAALGFFGKALALDPRFALASAQAATCYQRRKSWGWQEDAAGERMEAERLASRALELDSKDARVLALVGFVYAHMLERLEDGLALEDLAIELDPNLFMAWHWRGWITLFLGHANAERYFEEAARLSPLDPLMFSVHGGLAFAHFVTGRYEDSAAWAAKALRHPPHHAPALLVACAANAMLGRATEAGRFRDMLIAHFPSVRASRIRELGPLRRDEDVQHLVQALLRAGLPE